MKVFNRVSDTFRRKWHQLRNFVSRWWHTEPAVRFSTAFIAGDGVIGATLIIATGISALMIGNMFMFALMCTWASWEIFALTVVTRHVVKA